MRASRRQPAAKSKTEAGGNPVYLAMKHQARHHIYRVCIYPVRCYMLFCSSKMSGKTALLEVVRALAVAESVMQAGLGGLEWGVEGSLFMRSKMNVIRN